MNAVIPLNFLLMVYVTCIIRVRWMMQKPKGWNFIFFLKMYDLVHGVIYEFQQKFPFLIRSVPLSKNV